MQKLRQITACLALNLQIRLAGKAVKISRASLLFAVVFVFSLVIYTYTRASHAPEVYAATSSNLNFQGRILNSAGGVVPDGTYNLEFKLYDGGTSGGPAGTGQANAGSLLWTEDYINSARVRVVNGYFNVNLGSQTSFPGTINWDQELWLTMNVGGSGGTASWDGEMLGPSNARTKLTGVPYAFQAGSAKQLLDNQGSFKGILSFLSLTADRTINLPDKDGTVLLDSTGFANGGNSFGASATLGTNDLNDLILKTNNSEGLRLDQAGNVSIGTGVDALEKLDVNGGIKLGNSTGTNAGTLRWTGSDFEGYDGSSWKSLTVGPTTYINGSSASFVSGRANVGANVTGTAVETLIFTSATAVSNTVGVTGFTAPSNGSFSTCMIKNNAAITAGTLNLRWRVNGVSVGAGACAMNNGANNRQSSTALAPGTVTFNAGDTIGVAFDTVGMAPTTDDFTVYWSVNYEVGVSSAGVSFAQGGNSFGGTAVLGTTDNFGLNIETNGTNALTISNTQAASFTNTVSVANGLTVLAGGIDNSSGGITNAGSITGVGSNITSTAGLTIGSGGGAGITLDSASNIISIASTDTTLQRTASGSFSFDLNDTANTTLSLANSGTGLAGLTVEGSLSAAGSTFNVNTSGDITSAFTLLNGASTANGSGTNSTSLILTSATNFDIGNYVQVNSTNCTSGVNTCYAKITNKVSNTLTISPALTWANGSTVNEYHIPELGGQDTSQALTGRYGRGYFISGIATGNGTTYYNEDGITSSASTFDLLSNSGTTLNIGGGSTMVNLAGTVNITGTLSGDASGLTNISASSISSGTISDSQLSANIATLNGLQTFSGAKTFSAGLTISAGQSLTVNSESFTDLTGNGLTNTSGALSVAYGSSANTAVEGNTTLTCPSVSGSNLSGGGGTITLGAGGSCNSIGINNAVTFSTSVTSPIFTGSGAVALSSGGSSALTLDSASNTLIIDATDTGIQRTAAGTYSFDLNSSSATTFAINNSASGVAGLSVEGGASFGGNTSISGTLTGLTGLTVNSGGISISGGINNNSGGLTNVGSLAGVSTINANGLITGTAGLSVSGASTLINDASNFNTSINTGSSNGTVSIGGGSAVFQLDSTAFDVSNTGALSGITTLNATGAITGATATNTINGLVINSGSLSSISGYTQTSGNFSQTGTGSFATGSGAVNLNGATSVSTSTNSATALNVTGTTGTAATAVNIAQNGNASNLALTNTAITAGSLMSLTQSTSAFSGTGLLLNFASGSGSFSSGSFADFQVNGSSRFKVDNTGALQISSSTSTLGLDIQNTAGLSYFSVDIGSSAVRIGSSVADGTGVLLVLDTKNTTGDPTGINGGSYYNSFDKRMRCYEDGVWKDCISDTNVSKTADQNVTNSAAFTNDSSLFFPMDANSYYTFNAAINFSTTSAAADFKYTFTVPAGATLYLTTQAPTSATAITNCIITTSGQTCTLASTAGFRSTMTVTGYVITGATAGNLQYQFAQNTATAGQSATTYRGSSISWRRTQP